MIELIEFQKDNPMSSLDLFLRDQRSKGVSDASIIESLVQSFDRFIIGNSWDVTHAYSGGHSDGYTSGFSDGEDSNQDEISILTNDIEVLEEEIEDLKQQLKK